MSERLVVVAITQISQQLVVERYLAVASLALLLWDYAITFGDEVELSWVRWTDAHCRRVETLRLRRIGDGLVSKSYSC